MDLRDHETNSTTLLTDRIQMLSRIPVIKPPTEEAPKSPLGTYQASAVWVTGSAGIVRTVSAAHQAQPKRRLPAAKGKQRPRKSLSPEITKT